MIGHGRPGDQWQTGFWDSIDRGELSIQQCRAGHHQFPGGPICARCGEPCTWVTIHGTATVWSWAVFHHRYLDVFADLLPYTVLLLELDEGPWIYAGLHPKETREPQIGDRARLEIIDYPLGPIPAARFASHPENVRTATDDG